MIVALVSWRLLWISGNRVVRGVDAHNVVRSPTNIGDAALPGCPLCVLSRWEYPKPDWWPAVKGQICWLTATLKQHGSPCWRATLDVEASHDAVGRSTGRTVSPRRFVAAWVGAGHDSGRHRDRCADGDRLALASLAYDVVAGGAADRCRRGELGALVRRLGGIG